MINFRYHLISIVAVFLALSIGIVMGSTVIDRAIVDGLQNRIDTAEKNSIERKRENVQLRNNIEKQDAQDTVLAGHTVRNYLPGQTVYLMTIGNVTDTSRTEMMELLSVARARMGGVIRFSSDFLSSNKTDETQDLLKQENVSTFLAGEKDKNSQILTILSTALSVQAGGTSTVALNADAIVQSLSNSGALTQEEKTTSHDPVQPISFIVLIAREALQDQQTVKFVQNLYTSFPLSIGLEGADDARPTRSKSIDLLGDQLVNIAVVDNAESPSGRAALVVAHSQNITGGVHQIYGVSARAQSPAPPLLDQ